MKGLSLFLSVTLVVVEVSTSAFAASIVYDNTTTSLAEAISDTDPGDEINLLLGGNAAKVFKFPVPHERMFPTKEEIHDILGPASGA